jgi:hypothetical protein
MAPKRPVFIEVVVLISFVIVFSSTKGLLKNYIYS